MSSNHSPFSLPGFGQTGDSSRNPLLASMEMMAQAWQNLAGSGVLNQPPVAAGLTTEDLDRRINDLRAVENWLRINMSMLTSSIQALEVQRATIATLKSFANVPGAPADRGDNPSPLEVALGIKPSGQAKIKTPEPVREPSAGAGQTAAAEGQPDAPQTASLQGDPAALSDAAQGWWNMLQSQFDTLAAATVAGMQAGQQAQAEVAGAAAKRTATPRKSPGRQAGAAAKKVTAAAKGNTAAKRKSIKTAKTAGAAPARKRVVGATRSS